MDVKCREMNVKLFAQFPIELNAQSIQASGLKGTNSQKA